MAATLKLESMARPRPVLAIVKALQLDSIDVPVQGKSARAASKKGLSPAATSDDGTIQEGGRNSALLSLAGTMRRRDMSSAAIEAALQAENLARCNPPLDPGEVSGIAASIAKYPPASSTARPIELTDTGNADRFGAHFHDAVRYVPGLKVWLVWNGERWQSDQTGRVVELAKQVARNIDVEKAAITDEKLRAATARHCKSSQQSSRLQAMLDLSKSLPHLVVPASGLDCADMLLGVANGVVDLCNGRLLLPERERLMTRQASVAFDATAKCPEFLSFLGRITGNSKAIIRFLQRVFGYCLTGRTSEQCLFFLYGKGANGKSTLLNVLSDLLGSDYSAQTPSETLMARRGGMSNDIARLDKIRVVIANEVEDCSLLAESLVKQLTGGDVVSARFLHKEFFEFRPKLKLFIAGNHKPVIRGRDEGIWRRIRLIPFEVTIPQAQRDPHLQDNLRAELPGILNWALKGCKDWQTLGLAPPPVVVNASEAYRNEMDLLVVWIEECCTVAAQAEWTATKAYQSYKAWALNGSYKPMTSTAFGRELGERFTRVKKSDGNVYRGIGHRLPVS